jgi:hypothetical protein
MDKIVDIFQREMLSILDIEMRTFEGTCVGFLGETNQWNYLDQWSGIPGDG